MSPLLVFILIFSISTFARLHYRAGKRIRALEESMAEMAQANLQMAEAMSLLTKTVNDHDLNMIGMRSKLKTKEIDRWA